MKHIKTTKPDESPNANDENSLPYLLTYFQLIELSVDRILTANILFAHFNIQVWAQLTIKIKRNR